VAAHRDTVLTVRGDISTTCRRRIYQRGAAKTPVIKDALPYATASKPAGRSRRASRGIVRWWRCSGDGDRDPVAALMDPAPELLAAGARMRNGASASRGPGLLISNRPFGFVALLGLMPLPA